MIVLGNGSKATERLYCSWGWARNNRETFTPSKQHGRVDRARRCNTCGLFLVTSLLSLALGFIYGKRVVILPQFWLLGAFVKLGKAAIKFVMSVCLSVCLLGTTRLPLHEFS